MNAKNQVFSVDNGQSWQAMVNGKIIAADFNSKGAALAAILVEEKRQAKKKTN